VQGPGGRSTSGLLFLKISEWLETRCVGVGEPLYVIFFNKCAMVTGDQLLMYMVRPVRSPFGAAEIPRTAYKYISLP
jgi:hypothetical protein